MHYKNQGHQMKATSKTSGRRCPFTQQVVTPWMSLPQDALCTRNLQGFKKQQDEHMVKKTNKHTKTPPQQPH